MIRALLVLVAWLGVARADGKPVVALLPLDAPAQLEIYGQPVASEIARALKGGEIDVVVVGAKMAVPKDAILIVDGKIAQDGDRIALSLRVRRRADGVTLDDTLKTARPLAELDRAASELSGKLLPIVQAKLAAPQPAPVVEQPRAPVPPPKQAEPPPAAPPLLVATTGAEPLRAALAEAVARGRAVKPGDAAQLTTALAAKTVAAAGLGHGLALEVLDYRVEPAAGIPVARARVRVRIADARQVVFDRVVRTDSIVGDKASDAATLAARTAREVLAILRPHLAKAGL